MGIQYDCAVELAEARFHHAICSTTLAAMKAVTQNPQDSSVVAKHSEIYAEASSLLDEAEHHTDLAEEEAFQQHCEEMRIAFNNSHTFPEALLQDHEDVDGNTLACHCIKQYLSNSTQAEYSYSDIANPEGIGQDILNENAQQSWHFMMASLSLLDDIEIERILNENQALDHDESTYAVSSIKEVREWQTKFHDKTIAEVMNVASEAQGELIEAGVAQMERPRPRG